MDSRFQVPQTRGPSGFYSRMPSNLRPGIIFVAILGLFWSFASGVSAFRNVPFFNSNNESALAVYYIVMGVLCMIVSIIEIFGIFAVFSRRVNLVRIFAILSAIAVALVLATYIIQAAVHSHFRNDIITLCASANEGDHIFFTGFFGPVDGGIVTPLEAAEWCNEEFKHFTVSNIVALLVVTALAAIFAAAVFAYLRQLRNQSSTATYPMAAYNQNNQPQNPYATPLYNAPAYNNNVPAYNNERSNEVHVPLTDEFENDKPPTYVGEGLLDQKEKGYGGGEIQKNPFDQNDRDFERGYGEVQNDQNDRDFERGYGEVQNNGVNPPGPKYFA